MPPNVMSSVKSEVGLESCIPVSGRLPVPKRHVSNDTKCELPM